MVVRVLDATLRQIGEKWWVPPAALGGLPQVETPDGRCDRAARLLPLFGTTEIRKFAGACPRAGSQLMIELRHSHSCSARMAFRAGSQRKRPALVGRRAQFDVDHFATLCELHRQVKGQNNPNHTSCPAW